MTYKILTPTEWESLRYNLNPFYQMISDAYLHTGFQPTEFREFVQNPHWYLHGWHRIKLHGGREIFLSIEGTIVMDVFVDAVKAGNPMHRDRASFRDALLRSAVGADMELEGINPSMFRNTIMAWLAACFPEKMAQVISSLGCTVETLREVRKECVFGREDLEKMRFHLKGWGE